MWRITMYSISKEALDEAIDYAEEKKGYIVSSYDLLESLIFLIYDKKERMAFQEALRYSLNELYIRGEKRSFYRCAVGKYFSIMAARKRRANAAVGKKSPTKKKSRVTDKTVLEKSGQYALLI